MPGSHQTSSTSLREALTEEWKEIETRRSWWSGKEGSARRDAPSAGTPAPPPNLVGLALSGGGVRSATFALGLLQGLSRHGVLKAFDYVSTVSGGGFTGGWWSAWLSRPDRQPKDIFPEPERREPDRWSAYLRQDTTDAAMSARRRDPIHHLRLFANYLTPRKGTLSGDTWRAGTIVVRNLILTWLVLLPILLAATLGGQLYFTLNPDAVKGFVSSGVQKEVKEAERTVSTSAAAGQAASGANREAVTKEIRKARWASIRERAGVAARPLSVLLGWMIALTVLWMMCGPAGGRMQFWFTVLGTAGAGAIVYVLYGALTESRSGGMPWNSPWFQLFAAGIALLVIGFRLIPPGVLQSVRETARLDLLRNRIVRVHATLLVALAAVAAVLLVAGFSHDVVWYLFDPDAGGAVRVKQAGGWAAVATTVGAMLYTGFSGAPTGGDGTAHREPGLKSRLVFAAAPVLTVTLLAVLAAAVGRELITDLGQGRGVDRRIDEAFLMGIAVFLMFALFEVCERHDDLPRWRQVVVPAAAALVGAIVWWVVPAPLAMSLPRMLLWTGGAVALLLGGWAVSRAPKQDDTSPEDGPGAKAMRIHRAATSVLCVLAVVGLVWLHLRQGGVLADPPGWTVAYASRIGGGRFERTLLAVLVACAAFIWVERILAPSDRKRARGLVTLLALVVTARLLIPFIPSSSALYSIAAVTLMMFALVWVVGLGWMADPNMLSLHNFYKARLVRAYLGASNPDRRAEQITESAMGDDIRMQALRNCEVGAPYHLVNTTLNLVGGRDLTTAQRSADSFVIGKRFCGSSRTGYRPTADYMDGKLSVGTAVAVSGAAASPNMGSKTPSAALAMLMAFLNVRLAFWAPTPNRARWRDAQPRLWPFYLLRECLSQTNDLSAYCCLSDGGHFDNTGLYPLVARGCRYIVLSDCGADPTPCFEDMGNAIRRCRIDFGVEIDLNIEKFLRAEGKPAAAHFVVGSITYKKEHATHLGWTDTKDESLRGVIVWIKPALTAKDESVDVRQYALENTVFPQQTTADQWFDEAQFESYRRLGEDSADEVFGACEAPHTVNPAVVAKLFEDLTPKPPPSPDKLHFNLHVVNQGGARTLQVVEAEVEG